MAYNWVPIYGQYAIEANRIVFQGGQKEYQPGKADVLIGNLISDQTFGGGELKAVVRFEEAVNEKSGCEIILYYEPATQYFVCAGLGGVEQAHFSVRYFDNRGWNLLAVRGERANLKANIDYEVKVSMIGSLLSLWVSNVEVIRAVLPFTLPRGQVGLWFRGLNNIVVRDFDVSAETPTAFVAMQFSPPYNELFAEVVRPICNEFNIRAVRSDETFTQGLIIADIIAQINVAKIIIADITPENPNVFYEVGYAHAYRKPTILVAAKGRALPFDVSGFRTLFYENTIPGKRIVEDGLRKHLKAILSELRIPTPDTTTATAPGGG